MTKKSKSTIIFVIAILADTERDRFLLVLLQSDESAKF